MARIRTMIGIAVVSIAAAAAVNTLAMASETVNYTYDAKGRLVKVERTGSVNNNVLTNYVFDPADNRKNVKVTGAP